MMVILLVLVGIFLMIAVIGFAGEMSRLMFKKCSDNTKTLIILTFVELGIILGLYVVLFQIFKWVVSIAIN